MSFSPIDKVPLFPATPRVDGAVDDESLRDARGAANTSGESAPSSASLDPHAVMVLEAWPATGPRLFDTSFDEMHDATRTAAGGDLDQVAAHVVSFLI
jgi:hypothetical protein